MRNLKRVFSLMMMVAMLCSVMVIGSSAAYKDFTDKDKITHPAAVETLVSLGIINGKEDGSYYDPAGSLTRGEAAKLTCVVLNGGKTPVLGNPDSVSYKDTVDNWASPYIEYCTSLGIVAGDGKGYFHPNDMVTASQLSKMLLVALGYDASYEGLVGNSWSAKTDALANQNGLYDELSSLITSNVLNRDDAAQIIYNILDESLVYYPSTSGGVTSKAVPTGETVLQRYFNASEVEGYVEANDVFALAGSKCAAGKTRIQVATVNGEAKSASDTYTVNTSNDLVGQKVSLYVKNYGKTTATVVGSPVVSSDNKVATTCTSYSTTTKLDKFLDDNDLSLSSATAYSENGAKASSTADESAILGKMGNGVETRFMDNNGDGTVDYVLFTKYALSKITSYSTSSETLALTGVSGSIDFDDVADYASYAKGDYVLYVNYNGTYYLSAVETVSGTPTMYTSGKKLVIDGTQYAASNLENKTNNALKDYKNDSSYVNNSATFYLDSQGNIIATGDYVEATQNYALILASNAEMGAFGDYTGSIKLLKDDGSVSAYTVNLSASATKYLNYKDGILDYTAGQTAQTVDNTHSSSSVKQTAMASMLSNGLNGNTTTIPGKGNALEGMIVTYTMNSDGTVTIAPTTAYDKGKAISTPAVKGTASYDYDSKTVVANSNTLYFFSNGDTTSVVKGLSNLPSTASNSNVKFIAYSQSGSSYVAKAVYVSGTSSTASEDYVYVISGPDYYTNDKGEEVYDYTVAYSDGTTGKVSVLNKSDIAKGQVYSLSYENGYAVLDDTDSNITDSNIYDTADVTYAGNGTIQFKYTNKKDAKTYAKTLSVASDVTVVSVQDAADSLNNVTTDTVDSISAGAKISVTIDDNQIQHIYIIDYNA
ncbi:MAG: S-layer homology domain-containing protein [Oscillospiraceae bacterium]|nr:S-layer homology domain-containing protein [Oscillospiraceae bacterium]